MAPSLCTPFAVSNVLFFPEYEVQTAAVTNIHIKLFSRVVKPSTPSLTTSPCCWLCIQSITIHDFHHLGREIYDVRCIIMSCKRHDMVPNRGITCGGLPFSSQKVYFYYSFSNQLAKCSHFFQCHGVRNLPL